MAWSAAWASPISMTSKLGDTIEAFVTERVAAELTRTVRGSGSAHRDSTKRSRQRFASSIWMAGSSTTIITGIR